MLSASLAHAQLPPRFARAPLTEVALAQVGAPAAFERYGLTGAGSALCLVDTGVDPAAIPAARWVWDAHGAARGHALEETFGGAVLDPASVAAARDEHGHGTSMASIAVGEAGLAPAATLIVAAAYDAALGGFSDPDVVAGIRFCRAVAAIDDAIDVTRMVVLLSLGGHDGRHDGRGAFERAIVDAAGDLPVVVAAGNDGERAVHAAGRLFGGETASVEVRVPRSSLEDASVGVTLRFDARSEDAAAALVTPDGARWPIEPGRVELGSAAVDVVLRDDIFAITIGALSGSLPSGGYAIELRGSAAFEVWLAAARLGPTFFAPALSGAHVITGEGITIPATAPELIAVGATIARPMFGEDDDPLGEPGEVAGFSSRGPTPDGTPKPDLVAPGGWILTALSSDLVPGDPENLLQGRIERAVDGRVAVRGSSPAAAIVAGSLLLALELDPTRGADARELLVTSLSDAAWTPDRGYGELDVSRLLARWSDEASAPRDLSATRDLATDDRALWISARGDGRELTLDVGARRFAAPLFAGFADLAVDPGPLSAGQTIVVRGAIDGAALDPIAVRVVVDRNASVEIGGGGCRTAPGRGGACPLLTLLGLAALGRRSRGRSGPDRSDRRRRRGARPCS